MKSSRPCSSPFRWVLAFLLLAASTANSGAQNVAGFIHGKIQNFQQTSSAAPVMNATAPFQFGSIISMGTATINSATVTFTGTSSPRSYSPLGNGDFSILDTFPTQAQLDVAYGSGNYNLSINTSAGIFSRSIFFFGFFSYPTTPMLTVPANNWQSGMLVIDSAADYNFTWNTFAGGGSTDGIELVIREAAITVGPLPATQTSYTLPAGSLQPGTTYTCDLAFLRGAGTSSGDTVHGRVCRQRQLVPRRQGTAPAHRLVVEQVVDLAGQVHEGHRPWKSLLFPAPRQHLLLLAPQLLDFFIGLRHWPLTPE